MGPCQELHIQIATDIRRNSTLRISTRIAGTSGCASWCSSYGACRTDLRSQHATPHTIDRGDVNTISSRAGPLPDGMGRIPTSSSKVNLHNLIDLAGFVS